MDPRPVFLIPATRPRMVAALLASWAARPWAQDYRAVLVTQGFPAGEAEAVRSLASGLTLDGWDQWERVPPYLLRAEVWRRYPDAPVWISLDDDMEFTAETHFGPAVEKAREPGVGVVSCNWVRTESPALRRRKRFEHTFIEQPVVNTSGGLVMAARVPALVLRGPILPYLFDDIQTALVAYLAGLRNYRYLGSLLIHRTCHTGGLKESWKQSAFVPPDPTYWRLHRSGPVYPHEANNFLMPGPGDLTAQAHAEHRAARERAAGE